jgi:hypothetical protein
LPESEEDLDTGTELASFDKVFIVECFLELLIYFHDFTHSNKSMFYNTIDIVLSVFNTCMPKVLTVTIKCCLRLHKN